MSENVDYSMGFGAYIHVIHYIAVASISAPCIVAWSILPDINNSFPTGMGSSQFDVYSVAGNLKQLWVCHIANGERVV
jgi:hypothetical protein